MRGGKPWAAPPTPENLSFATAELDAVLDRAIVAGAERVSSIETRPGRTVLLDQDPDGGLCFVDDTTLFLGRDAEWS